MIRHPINSAIGRTTADFGRVADGIASSLRAFSTAQRLAVPPPDNRINSSSPRTTTGRQRAAAAISDLVEMSNSSSGGSSSSGSGNSRPPPSKDGGYGFRTLDLRSDAASGSSNNIIRGGGGLSIIRGGLPGGFRAGRGGGPIRGGGMMGRGGRGGRGRRGGGRGGGMGAGRRGGGRRGGRGGRGGRSGGERDEEGAEGEGRPKVMMAEEDAPDVLAMREAKEMGALHQFDPSISMADLVGWGSAVPATGSAFARDETVIRQARILGSGQPFHPLHTLRTADMRERYADGTGVFFPNQEMKKRAAAALGLEAFPPVPAETKDAILQDALLGTYRGPQYADPNNTLGVVQSYVRRDASWNADAERRIEAKIKSLLPGGNAGPTRPPAAGAKAKA